MAIFRKGIKVGKHDIRTGLSKERGQGILRKVGILPDDKGRKKFESYCELRRICLFYN